MRTFIDLKKKGQLIVGFLIYTFLTEQRYSDVVCVVEFVGIVF